MKEGKKGEKVNGREERRYTRRERYKGKMKRRMYR